MVKFNNTSERMQMYQWNFGFVKENGEQVILTDTVPTIFFPANGTYRISLMGYDQDGLEYKTAKSV